MYPSGRGTDTRLIYRARTVNFGGTAIALFGETQTAMNIAFKNQLALFVSTIALLSVPALRSQTLTFNVDLNTALLNAQDGAHAPFSLDFQLTYGNSALATNTATLSNFLLTGGNAVGSAVTTGSASGSLSSTVLLSASSAHPFNELYQQFTSGVTNIQFTATITETGPDVGVPSEFTVAILDDSLGSPAQLFTNAPDTESLVTLDLSSSNTINNVDTYRSLSSADGNTPVTGVSASVPETSMTLALAGCAAALLVFCSRRFGVLQTA